MRDETCDNLCEKMLTALISITLIAVSAYIAWHGLHLPEVRISTATGECVEIIDHKGVSSPCPPNPRGIPVRVQ